MASKNNHHRSEIVRFSVIIPVYNKADTIRKTLESVFSQTYKDFEIIIVDDGSSDNLQEALAVYENRISVIRQENGGVSVARNTGIKNATGDYVCFLDADDLWKENHLSVLSELIDKYPDCGNFVTSHIVTDGERMILDTSKYLTEFGDDLQTEDFLGLLNSTSYSVVHTNSVCIKRTVFDDFDIHFEEGVRIGEDSDVWYRAGMYTKTALSSVSTTVYCRENSTATNNGANKNPFYTEEWIFASRENDFINDVRLTDDVKKSAVALIDRYRLLSCRELVLAGNRKDAKNKLALVKNRRGKHFLLTKMFIMLPYALCRFLMKR